MFDEGVFAWGWGGGALGLLNSKKQNSEAQLAPGFGIGSCGPDLPRLVFSGGCTTLLDLPVSSVLSALRGQHKSSLPHLAAPPSTGNWLSLLYTPSTSFQTTG